LSTSERLSVTLHEAKTEQKVTLPDRDAKKEMLKVEVDLLNL